MSGDADDVVRFWERLGLPGIIDVHTHFMPERVLRKVWAYFDSAGPLTGMEWPIEYRHDEDERLALLRSFECSGSPRCSTRTRPGWRPG